MYKVRDDEPDYAFIPPAEAPQTNRYGQPIDLATADDPLVTDGLVINGEVSQSDNPNRYKQHGFYFNADNCISCHACESACSLKNDLPPYLAYRAVGYVEGGSYPDYTRVNISMACNHCDNPVCLKGCPTRAYTKFAEYGAVLQDPDICFGCGYCTWVCPYNAPQLDTERGHVHKCNMCVDRLEVGLKPACAAACLAGALDFGVIETTPENREQLETRIPGFPTPEITHPNIRFQQIRSLPREMTRPDSIPLRYEQDEPGKGPYKPKVRDLGKPAEWNLRKLRSREDPLVIFTLISQGVIGAFLALFLGPLFGLDVLSADSHPLIRSLTLFVLLGLETFALALSTFHLGRPHRFYRAFNNLRYSPVSREVAGIAVFFNLLAVYTILEAFPGLFGWLPDGWYSTLLALAGWGAVLAGPLAIWFMHRIYRIPARPFWNHWQVLTSFYGNMLALGSLFVMLVYGGVLLAEPAPLSPLLNVLGWPLFAGLLMEGFGLWRHGHDLQAQGGEGAAAHYQQRTTFGKTWRLRNGLLGLAILASLALALWGQDGALTYGLWFLTAVLVLAATLIGRALFYVLVIPTTMPGAFFWRNRGFQEHARETGLAEMPQVGVLPETH
jgi:DMSO reductase iron-sulfur subunit